VLLPLLVSGIANGGVYALVALGFTLIYRSTRLLNFAHGEMFTLGAYIAFTLYGIWKWPLWLSIVGTLVGGALLGLVIDRVCARSLATAPMISGVLVTIGISFVLKGLARLIWLDDYLTFPPLYAAGALRLGPVVFSAQDAIIIGVALGLTTAFFAMFRFSRIGKQLRASASNRIGAALVGIRVGAVFGLAWALSGIMAAVAGLLVAPISLVYPDMGFSVFVKAFAGAVLGGLGSFPGAVLGSVLVGVAENLAGGFVSTALVGPAPFLVIFIVLLLFPRGLFGRA
jgi:branched-chain amino acid transport system permease protein